MLSTEEAREKSEEIMGDLMKYKQSMEMDMANQESALHSRLSELKKKQLAAKVLFVSLSVYHFLYPHLYLYLSSFF